MSGCRKYHQFIISTELQKPLLTILVNFEYIRNIGNICKRFWIWRKISLSYSLNCSFHGFVLGKLSVSFSRCRTCVLINEALVYFDVHSSSFSAEITFFVALHQPQSYPCACSVFFRIPCVFLARCMTAEHFPLI